MKLTRTTGALAAATLSLAALAVGSAPMASAEPRATVVCFFPDSGADANATARKLVTKFFRLIKEKDRSGMAVFLDKAWMGQTADGTGRDRKLFLDTMPNIQSFTIANVNARMSGFLLVTRYQSKVKGDINGNPYSTDFAPRLASFSFCTGEWKMISQANFDPLRRDPQPTS